VATTDFITPVCDDPRRFGRIAAANSISDVYAMGGRPLFVLNLCCFPKALPLETLSGILEGAAETTRDAGAVLLGGHSVKDEELKFGLAVVGEADPRRLLTNAGARPGQKLLLTKPLGTGVLINAFKADKLDEEGLEPALLEMERLNQVASELALRHGVTGATDITGFGLTGHALGMAKASGVGIRFAYDRLPIHSGFFTLVERGVSTGSTAPNRRNVEAHLEIRASLDDVRRTILYDPQTSGGLLLATPPESSEALLAALLASGHQAAEIGEVLLGAVRIEVV
jgi:selenide, water dikinase